MTAHPASAAARDRVCLAVIGGSGFADLPGLHDVHEERVVTPFGAPSGPVLCGALDRPGRAPLPMRFLSRFGDGHVLAPGEVNYRANIHALKQLGATHVIAVSPVGSLQEHIEPGHMVLCDQFIDRTQGRRSSFFGGGAVAHVQFGEPTDAGLRARLLEVLRGIGQPVHNGGVYVCMEGPAFSTRAESELYRRIGAHVIGMTAIPEAKLAREAELGYALLALASDYDCWKDHEVSVDLVMQTVAHNLETSRAAVLALARGLPERCEELPYPQATHNALITRPDAISAEARARLDLIIGHRL